MTVKEYISSKLQSFDIDLSEADLFDISTVVGLDEELTTDNRNKLFYALVKSVIPMLLLRAKSISENGFSYSYDTNDVLNFHSWLCKELGIEDTLNETSKISDASDIW